MLHFFGGLWIALVLTEGSDDHFVCEMGNFRLNIRMNYDHLRVILDEKETILDIYFPFRVDYENVKVKLMADHNELHFFAPVIW
ncbi:unnamed protein product [Gongylonema pulchrum]|uniref:Galectin n=1 Tax=Gongylonema pulchrum TaxID=637853 RepID=A0A183F198_9BILA|nr:unnamed protein product [Gongylonema pulchrum]